MHELKKTHLGNRSGQGLSVCILCSRLVTAQFLAGFWPHYGWVRMSLWKIRGLMFAKWWTEFSLRFHAKISLFVLLASQSCCLHFAAVVVVCRHQAAKAESIFKNAVWSHWHKGMSHLETRAQMQRKPKILTSWRVSFSLRWAWVCVWFRDTGR
jgi:hypothetical protein